MSHALDARHALAATVILAAASALLLACGEPAAPDALPESEPWARIAAATGAFDLAPGDVLRIEVERTRETWQDDVHADDEPPHAFSDPEREELVISASGASARRWEADGLPALRVIRGDGGWQRVGGVVIDVPATVAQAETTEVRDWLTLLGATQNVAGMSTASLPAAPAGTYVARCEGDLDRRVTIDEQSALPSRLEIMAAGTDPAGKGVTATLEASGWRTWDAAAGLRFPQRLTRTSTRGLWNTIERATVLSVARLRDASVGIPPRPDTSAPPTLGEPQRRRVPARDAAIIEHTGLLTDLPGLHRALAGAVEVTRADRRGPDVLEFENFPGDDGVATLKLHCPVAWSHDALAGELPNGVLARRVGGADVLAFTYRGRYPGDPAIVATATSKARELGLVRDGPARFVIMSDPVTAQPGEIDAELLLPVREAE